MRGIRCFVAVDLPEEIKSHLPSIQERLSMDGLKLVEPELVHITLKFLGRCRRTGSMRSSMLSSR